MILLLLLMLAVPAVARDQVMPGTMETALTADGGHSFGDAYRWSQVALVGGTLLDASSSWGGSELNPVLGRGDFGNRQMAVMLSITVAVLVLEEICVRMIPASRSAFVVVNFVAAAGHGVMAGRNLGLR